MGILIFSKTPKGNKYNVKKKLQAYLLIFVRDYADNEQLDNYENEGVDDQHYDPIDLGARNALDNNLNKRDVEIRRREGRVAGAFIYGLDDEVNDSLPTVRRHRHIYDTQNVDADEDGVVSLVFYKKGYRH